MSTAPSLAKSYTFVGSATLASRLTGFVRDVLIAALLGSGAIADAYVAAFLLPNLFRRVLSEGAFNAAFVPIYARLKADEGDASVTAFMENALSSLVALVLAALLVAEIAMPALIAGLTPGFTAAPEKFEAAVAFGRISFVFVGALIIAALLSSMLNAKGRFALVALAPLILNIMLIGALAGLLALGWRGEYRAGLALVVTVLLAGIVQLLYVAHGLRRSGLSLRIIRPRADRDVKTLLMLLLPGLVIAGAGHFNMVIAAQLSSSVPSAISWLYYADRIFQLPLGFVAAAIGTVLLPAVARAYRDRDLAGAAEAGNRALEFGLLLVLPATVALLILADPIVDIIYRHGAFSHADSAATAAILKAIALGLPGFVLVKVFLPPYLAREQFRIPMIAALAGIAANVLITLTLFPRFGVQAAPLGVAASGWINAAILAAGLATHQTFILDQTARRRLPGIIAATMVTGLATFGLYRLVGAGMVPTQPFAFKVGLLALLCLTGLGVHSIAAHAFGAANLGALKAMMTKRP